MKKVYVILICLMCLLLVSTTVIAKNVSNNIISENDIQENILTDNTINDENDTKEDNEEENAIDNQNQIENGISLESLEYDGPIVKEGTYRIATSSNPLIGLDIESGSTSNKANVHVWNYTGVKQAQFKLEYVGDGYYKIINVKSGKVLDVDNNGKTNGTNVWQYTDNGTDAQRWKIVKTSDGYYNIVAKSSGLVLDVKDNKIECGSNVQIYKNNGTNAQKFQFLSTDMIKSTKIIDEGKYRISSALKTSANVDLASGSTANKANIHLWTYEGKDQQKFRLEYSNGYYIIRNLKSNKVLDVDNNGKSSGTNVQQYTYNGTDAQKWIIQKTSDGYYNIISKSSGLYLDVSNAGTSNGTNIQVYRANGTKSQKFNFVSKDTPKGSKTLSDGTYRIVSAKNEDYGLDVSNANKNNKTNVQIWKWDNVDQQRFNISYDGNGYYTIIPVHSGSVLDVDNAGKTNRTNIWQYANNGSNAQKWVIKSSGNGTYNIISKIDSMYMDVANGTIANGTNIQLYEPNGTASQQFKFIEVDQKSEKTVEEGNYRIAYGVNNNYGLDVASGSTANKANVQLWKYTNVKQQKFEVKYTDGFYKIKCINSEKYLEASNDNVYQNAEKDINAQKWTIRRTSDGHYTLISKLNGLCMDLDKSVVANGTNIKVYKSSNNNAQKYDFIKVGIGLNIDTKKYPGVQEAVDKLAAAHPNWSFEPVYLNLDFDDAVEGEYKGKKTNLIDSNVYQGSWIRNDPYHSGNWYSPSEKAVAYFMDIRNFLNEKDIFQFQNVNDYLEESVTIEGLKGETKGTWLEKFTTDLDKACKDEDVNPYFILARLFQEQGSKSFDKTSSIATGMKDGNKTYYNPFNIGAKVGDDYNTALARAKDEGWDSMEKGIEGGIEILKKNYLDKKQNTLYMQKFDVDASNGTTLYTNQYMQNLSAAYSEARILQGMYEDENHLNLSFTFLIPLYENMSKDVSPRPTNDNEAMSAKVINVTSHLNIRASASTSGKDLGDLHAGDIVLSVERGINSKWHRIVTTSRDENGYSIVGYVSGDYLEIINDKTNANYKATVKTADGIGVNLREGPSVDFDKAGAVKDGTEVTVISNGVFHTRQDNGKNDFWWDWCVLDDGRKAFIPTNYLKKK